MDYELLIFTLAVFGVGLFVGSREYLRQARLTPDMKLEKFHRQPGWVRFFLLLLTLLLCPAVYFVMNRPGLWAIPEWLDLSLLWWVNGAAAALFGILAGLGRGAWQRERKPNTRALVLAAELCGLALLANTAVNQRFVANQVSDLKYSGEPLLQTSSYSCAAASGANVAGLFGFRYSERDMARFMATRTAGTSPAGIICGLKRAGLLGRKFTGDPMKPEAIPLPAILLVYHPVTGRESHALAALKYLPDQKLLETWDPLSGRRLLSCEALAKIWDNHGIAVTKP